MYPTTAHFIFFGVFFVAALPILFYYRRRNPDPRFRPHLGEMTMVTIFAVFICGGLAFGLGSLFRAENDGRESLKKPNEGAGWSMGLSRPSAPERSRRPESKDREDSRSGGRERPGSARED